MLKELVSSNRVDTVPKGWKTTKEWCKEEGLAEVQIGRYLRQGIAAGLLEMKRFRIVTGQMVRPVPHYRIKGTQSR